MKNYNKPLVVITGASSGFGMALAKAFSKDGYPLLLLARRVARMEALQLPNTLCEAVDVTDAKSFETAVRKAEAVYGPTDLLVNNAGVMLLGDLGSQDPKRMENHVRCERVRRYEWYANRYECYESTSIRHHY